MPASGPPPAAAKAVASPLGSRSASTDHSLRKTRAVTSLHVNIPQSSPRDNLRISGTGLSARSQASQSSSMPATPAATQKRCVDADLDNACLGEKAPQPAIFRPRLAGSGLPRASFTAGCSRSATPAGRHRSGSPAACGGDASKKQQRLSSSHKVAFTPRAGAAATGGCAEASSFATGQSENAKVPSDAVDGPSMPQQPCKPRLRQAARDYPPAAPSLSRTSPCHVSADCDQGLDLPNQHLSGGGLQTARKLRSSRSSDAMLGEKISHARRSLEEAASQLMAMYGAGSQLPNSRQRCSRSQGRRPPLPPRRVSTAQGS